MKLLSSPTNSKALVKYRIIAALILYCIILFWLCIEVYSTSNDYSNTLRNLGLFIVAALSIPFGFWRVHISGRNATTTFDTLINSRIDRASEQLASTKNVPKHKFIRQKLVTWDEHSPDIEARLGGLRILQKVVMDSPTERLHVLQTICAYIEHNSPLNSNSIDILSISQSSQRADVQAATDLLRMLDKPEFRNSQNIALYIRNAFLQKSFFKGTKLHLIDFTGSDLSHSNLENNDFSSCFMQNVSFQHSNLKNVVLNKVVLRGADLRNTKGLTAEMLEQAYGVNDGFGKTILSEEDEHLRPKNWFQSQQMNEDSFELLEAFRNHYF